MSHADLEAEVIIDSDGRRIDQSYVDELVAVAHDVLAQRTGRPSLTVKASSSPQVTFRVTPELKVRAEQAAAGQGATVSQLAREAFERFLASRASKHPTRGHLPERLDLQGS